MEWLVRLVDRHAAKILAITLLLTLFMLPGLKRITISRGFDHNLLPAFNELVRSVQEVRRSFGANIRQIIISVEMTGEQHITHPFALELISDITSSLKKVPLLRKESILSLASVKDFTASGDDIGSELLIEKRPNSDVEIAALEQKISKNPFFYGRLVSKDFKSALILATAYDNADLAHIHDQVASALAPLKDKLPTAKITLLGDPEVNYQIFTSIERDIVLFVIIGIFLILFSFFVMFGTWHGVVLPLFGIIAGIIWTMGIIGYYGEPITLLSATIPVVLVIMGGEYALHVFHSLLVEKKHSHSFHAAYKRVVESLFFPLSVATLMSFIGGVTLVTFKIYPIQHFGVFTAIGAVVSMLISMIVIPSLFKVLQKPVETIEDTVAVGVVVAKDAANFTLHHIPVAGPVTGAIAETLTDSVKEGVVCGWKGFWARIKKGRLTDRMLEGIAQLVVRYPIVIISILPLILVPAIHYSKKIEFGFDNISFLPKSSPIRSATYRLDEAFGGTQKFDLLIDAKKSGGILEPEFLAKVEQFEKEATELTFVNHGFSVVHLLKKVHAVLGQAEKSALPASKEAASQYLFLLGMSQTGLPLSSLVSADHQKMKLTLNLSAHDTKDADEVYKKLEVIGHRVFGESAKVVIGGDLVYSIAMTRYLVWGKVQNILSSLLTMFLVIALIYRSLTKAMLTCLPLPIGCLLNFGLMGALGIRLDFVTAIITSFASGLGVDFAIHFVAGVRDTYKRNPSLSAALKKTILGPGKVMVYSAVCNILGFSVLLLSNFAAIHTFAVMMCFNMVVLLLSTLIVIPAVIRLVRPEFITQRREKSKLKEGWLSLSMKVGFSSVAIIALTIGIYLLEAKAADSKKDAKAPSVESVMDKAIATVYSTSEEATYVMKLMDSGGQESVRKMRVWFKRLGDKDAKLLIKISEPADLRGTGLLSVVEKGNTTDQWLYLPTIKKTRRIKGGNQEESFLGSDFTVSDLSIDKQDRFKYLLQGSTACGDKECYVMVGTPASAEDASSLPYSKKIVHIRKDNFVAVRTEFFNQAGQLEKVMTLQNLHLEGGKHWISDKAEMKNLLTHHSTVIEIQKRDISKSPADSLFTQANLERN